MGFTIKYIVPNQKLGLRPAGQRAMMKLPQDRAARNRITAAACPECGHHGAIPSKTKGGAWVMCTWCAHVWELPA